MPGFASLLVASAAVRVASLNMCTDEYLLLLARPQEIASVSRLSRDPRKLRCGGSAGAIPATAETLEGALRPGPTCCLRWAAADDRRR